MTKRILIIILIGMGIFFKLPFAESTTSVSGTITSNTTWTSLNSPYIVVGTVSVESDRVLTIEPGVVVKFATSTSLISYGRLTAIGEETNKIVFTSFKDETNGQGTSTIAKAGDWGGIKLSGNGANGSEIKYCIIKYGRQAICLEYANNIVISNNVIAHHKGGDGIGAGKHGEIGGGIYLFSGKYNVIKQNTIMNINGGKGGDGNWGWVGDKGGNGGRGIGIYLYLSDITTIINNNIYNIQGGDGGYWITTAGEGIGIFLNESNYNEINKNYITNRGSDIITT